MWAALLKSILPSLFGAFQKYFALIAAYAKGGADRQNKIELKTAKKTADEIQDANQAANDAGGRADAGKLRDSDYRD